MTCKDVPRLVSQALDRPLSFKQRVGLRLHFLLCRWCARYAKHLKFLHQAAPRYEKEIEGVVPRALSPDAKQRLKQALQNDRGA